MKEYDIRPKALFDAFLEVSRNDIARYFSDKNAYVHVPCPACLSTRSEPEFDKHGFNYKRCLECFSLFVSPRPTSEMINTFYRESDSSKFWAERFFPETAVARTETIFKPRALVIKDILNQYQVPHPVRVADIGAGIGLFLQQVQEYACVADVVAIEPSFDLARVCRERGFKVVEKTLESIEPGEVTVSVACSFEVLEHLFDPSDFLKHASRILEPGGLLMMTTLTASGFDLLVLGEKSKSISPPHHINFLSVEGFETLFRRSGFTPLEIATPGQLDVDIVKNMLREDPLLNVPSFEKYVLNNRDQNTWNDLQSFLQRHALSSHVRVIARKNA